MSVKLDLPVTILKNEKGKPIPICVYIGMILDGTPKYYGIGGRRDNLPDSSGGKSNYLPFQFFVIPVWDAILLMQSLW